MAFHCARPSFPSRGSRRLHFPPQPLKDINAKTANSDPYVNNSDGNAVAYPVLTAQNNQITNVTHLAKFVDNGVYRLYFNTDSAGTEFAGLGTELWVVGNDL